MYNIGICDDEKSTCAELESMIFEYKKRSQVSIDVDVWYSGESLCNDLKNNNEYDLIFLDIELMELSGMEVGYFIRNQLEDYRTFIVYISSKRSYAMHLFKTQPLDFLVKPIRQEDINEILNKCLKIWEKRNLFFGFQKGGSRYNVLYDEIVYFCSDNKKIQIISIHDKKDFYGKIKTLILNLPSNFILIHQSYIINYNFISKCTYDLVDMVNGDTLTISKPYRKEVRKRILDYQKERNKKSV